ncbi:MAG: hypothetical protein EBR82_75905 [Caulobacteraceae bacterium]|nr:hypothetical protein [Caulobacteraceae bacterium]
MLAHRGFDHINIARRNATKEEMDECGHPYRIGYCLYNNWTKLIIDEKKFTDDPEWLDKLEELKKQFPQFDKNPKGQLQLKL